MRPARIIRADSYDEGYSGGGESSARLISGHRSISPSPDALMYGLRAKEGSRVMRRGERGSSVYRKADRRIAWSA